MAKKEAQHLTPLQRRRGALGLTQEEVAAGAAVSLKTYQQYEYYRVEPGVLKALRIAVVLRTSVEALWGEAFDAA
jgi:DNA-binding XRE family transcriptional regulator